MTVSIRSQVIEIAWDLFEKQGELTTGEIRAKLKARGVVLSPKNTTIRSTIYQMMKADARIQRTARGGLPLHGGAAEGAGICRSRGCGAAGAGDTGDRKKGQEKRKKGKGHYLYPGTGGKNGAGCHAA